jgi:hypothetical protein
MLESSATSVPLGPEIAGGVGVGKEAGACTGGGAAAAPPAGFVRIVTFAVISLQASQTTIAFQTHAAADIKCNLRFYLRVESSSVARATSSGATSNSMLIFILTAMGRLRLAEEMSWGNVDGHKLTRLPRVLLAKCAAYVQDPHSRLS